LVFIFPPLAVEIYNTLQSGFSSSFRAMAIVLLIFGELAAFFAFPDLSASQGGLRRP